mmetsp:Transcript_17529/g.44949  ORF Transcript_17529/g.44949 Transcript_17529/m.44949 type:complete len:267 (-) Transcript_17529:578-1378(-)
MCACGGHASSLSPPPRCSASACSAAASSESTLASFRRRRTNGGHQSQSQRKAKKRVHRNLRHLKSFTSGTHSQRIEYSPRNRAIRFKMCWLKYLQKSSTSKQNGKVPKMVRFSCAKVPVARKRVVRIRWRVGKWRMRSSESSITFSRPALVCAEHSTYSTLCGGEANLFSYRWRISRRSSSSGASCLNRPRRSLLFPTMTTATGHAIGSLVSNCSLSKMRSTIAYAVSKEADEPTSATMTNPIRLRSSPIGLLRCGPLPKASEVRE